MAVAAALVLLAGCGGSEADALSRAREAAAQGIEAAERYCTMRDSLLALPLGPAARDALLETSLRAPEPLDEYCVHRGETAGGH